jgi:capsular polysaccharide biosynthesis protein
LRLVYAGCIALNEKLNVADYARPLLRRWPLILVVAILGAIAGLLIPTSALAGPAGGTYVATAELTPAPPGSEPGAPTLTLPEIVIAGQTTSVLRSTSSMLGLNLDPTALGARLGMTPTKAGTVIEVAFTGASPDGAANVVNAFTGAMQDYLSSLASQTQQQAVKTAEAVATSLQDRITATAGQIAALQATTPQGSGGSSNPQLAALQAQNQGLVAAYVAAYQNYANLASAPPPPSGLVIVQPASAATAIHLARHTSLLGRLRVRAAIGFVFGFLVGVALVLVLEYLRPRIRSRQAAESALGMPVVAEIPPLRLHGDLRDVVVVSAPSSGGAEAYRILRTAILVGSPLRTFEEPAAKRVQSPGSPPIQALPASSSPAPDGLRTTRHARPGRVIAIVSAADEPTRPIVATTLGATFAETGSRTLVIGTGGSAEAGPLARDGDVQVVRRSLSMIAIDSEIPGVQVANLGEMLTSPGDLSARAESIISEARRLAEIVVLDAGAVLATHDIGVLGPLVDCVVVVAQCGLTMVSDARRASELLALSRCPVYGAVLTEAAVHYQQRRPEAHRRQPRTLEAPKSAADAGVPATEAETATPMSGGYS